MSLILAMIIVILCQSYLLIHALFRFIFQFTGFINIIIDIWALVNLHRLDKSLEPHEKWVLFPPGTFIFNLFLFEFKRMLY